MRSWGDIIGSPFEFTNVRSTTFPLFARGAQCTDDSILTIATAHALLTDGDYAAAYQSFFHAHPNAPYGSRFVVWANRRLNAPYNSLGNGSAMRVSPISWALSDLNDILDEAERSAAVTHNHPEGILGAQAIAVAVFLARTTHDLNAVRDFITAGCGYSLPESIAAIRPTYEFDATCRGTIPVAVQAFLESTDFESALRLSISAGGDSDTIASITAALAHAHYGAIPPHLLRPTLDIYLKPDLLNVTLEFCARFNVPR